MSAYKAAHPHRLGTVGLVALVGLILALAIVAGPAHAFVGYSDFPNVVFGTPGSGTGQLTDPHGVAVEDASGDVYVVDRGDDRIEKFDANGAYLAQIGGAETPAGSFSSPGAIAVDNSSGATKDEVYVADAGHAAIDVFAANGKYLRQITGTPAPFTGALEGVAVDAAGDLWAYDSGGDVDEFNAAGGFLKQFNTGRGTEAGLAVDSSGDVYVLLSCGCIGKYDTSGTSLAEWGSGRALAVNEQTNNVFLDTGSSIEEYGPLGEPYGAPIDTFAQGSVSPGGVAVDNATGAVYASRGESDTVAIFKRGLLPDVSTGGTGEVTRTGATLDGTVDPDGQAVTSCELEYGPSSAYGQSAPCVPAPGSGSSPVAVSAAVGGLAPASIYHYRLIAGNANGVHVGADATFTTVPAVEGVSTGEASEVLGTSATLTGSLEPSGFDAHYLFEYGCAQSGCDSVTSSQDAGSAHEVVQARVPLSGLTPNTRYHFRIAAENTFGTTSGEEREFSTPAIVAAIGTQLAPVTTRVSATLGWEVNPENSETTYRVLYGPTDAYGEHTETGVLSGYGEDEIVVGLDGLAPETTYHYALQATNQAGTVTGPDETLRTGAATPPTALTGEATELQLTSATVTGTIDPEDLETSYELDFGTDAGYGTSIYGEVNAGTEAIEIPVHLQNLAPGTTYHYRIVAINGDGRTYGADRTFTTPPYSNPIVLPHTLPLLATPQIAFPTETKPTQNTTKPKTAKGKKGKVEKRKRKKRKTKATGHKHKRKQ